VTRLEAVLVLVSLGVVDRDGYHVGGVDAGNADPSAIDDRSVANQGRSAVRFGDVNAVLGETEDIAILYVQSLAAQPPDPVESTTDSVDSQISKDDNVVASGLHYDPVGAGDQNRGDLSAATVNGDGLGDGKGAEATWIEGINFASKRRLGDGTSEGLARCRAAAGISVITYARYPGPGRLAVTQGHSQQDED